MTLDRDTDLFLLEGEVWLLARTIGSPTFDFMFDRYFACRRPYERPEEVTAIARLGAFDDYPALFDQLRADGITLVNSPPQHRLASELPAWYPLLEGLTPRSAWFDEIPPADVVERQFGWPVFVKGARSTAKHSPGLAIASNATEFAALAESYQRDRILHWQTFCVREYLQLRPVEGRGTTKIRPSFEFRTFWYRGQEVGAGRYWHDFATYDWSSTERLNALRVAQTAARRLEIPFVVVDIAQTIDGRWVVIECNDAQESGHAGVSPFALWQRVVEVAKGERDA
jgi:hypothetical protein